MDNNTTKEATKGGGGPAQTLVVGDQIAVNLVATKPDGSRMSAAGLFNHMGEAIDASGKSLPNTPGLDVTLLGGKAMPEFPMAKYQELLEQGSVEAAEDLKAAYELDMQRAQEEGAQSLPDAIATAAFDWAHRCYGVQDHDSGDGPYIKPDQIVVKNVVREHAEQPGVFTVQITPSWGAR